MGKSPSDEQSPLLDDYSSRQKIYSFLYPGHGTHSTLNVNDAFNMGSQDEISPVSEPAMSQQNMSMPKDEESGRGSTSMNYDLSEVPPSQLKKISTHGEHKIGQLLATAICGNDITSSIFYTSASCTQFAGIYAPFSLMMVCIVLYLFRKVYGEVGSALPLNGGAYNVLLNTTTKQLASLAAALTMISYIATAVVSAYSAMDYFNGLVPSVSDHYSTIVLLALFACLNLVGIGESAVVAAIIFIFHMVTLLMLVFGGFFMFFYRHDWSVLSSNWNTQNTPTSFEGCQVSQEKYLGHNFAYNIYFGFGAAMLGVTGFETSSNFIEQQEPGVFPKTLRNMWAIVTFFNPLIGFLNLCFMHTCFIVSDPTGGVLANLAEKIFGQWFRLWVGIDAVAVLSGSVITSYVGVIGLIRRMALDRCLPQFLLQENSCRKTNHFIILTFFVVCTSLFVLADFDTRVLTGVYTIAFLGVMSLFGLGNMLLKYKRSSLKRDIISPWWGVTLAIMFVLAALVANIIGDPSSVAYFAVYFLVMASVILIMFIRAKLLKVLMYFTQMLFSPFPKLRARITASLSLTINTINSQPIVFFASKDDLAYLNKAILYIRENEQTNWVRIIHCYTGDVATENMTEHVTIMDKIYPKIRIDLITVKADFNPSVIEKISLLLKVPKNFMFIACPKDHLPHSIGDFGGVRMVTIY
ncbi:hypothetical protein SAMD00019534_084130 [Acytostelium subglobosum LB1]|uniref:hypothetical protein n=1 Tax=Acytostelium subglobosum LB1 TaxID=1410327 RepID=UPI00064500F6|nr:hypothetical protein SAMD00019534_084130 [Acytostelium subglobosum LB1]GAM25238.1 hypothetical protein SAMD00019534_084130 [Acytostelium subglobosum LB1]|eukprot:XP_012751758.1 hypothetical protein SAMD00019534_084130 [Acytostelium subglobosum LB1]